MLHESERDELLAGARDLARLMTTIQLRVIRWLRVRSTYVRSLELHPSWWCRLFFFVGRWLVLSWGLIRKFDNF